jgi:hypothetical protein
MAGAPASKPAARTVTQVPTVKARSGVGDGVKIGIGMFVLLPLLVFGGCCAVLALSATENPSRVLAGLMLVILVGVVAKVLIQLRSGTLSE